MYSVVYMYVHVHVYIVCVVEGGSCGDRCDSGTHPQRTHSQRQSLQCT